MSNVNSFTPFPYKAVVSAVSWCLDNFEIVLRHAKLMSIDDSQSNNIKQTEIKTKEQRATR